MGERIDRDHPSRGNTRLKDSAFVGGSRPVFLNPGADRCAFWHTATNTDLNSAGVDHFGKDHALHAAHTGGQRPFLDRDSASRSFAPCFAIAIRADPSAAASYDAKRSRVGPASCPATLT